jgi:NAD(P)-dependent dehydrogenase (short-subunit alcohol dehydrogenase family)
MQNVAIVTGATSGIGKAILELLLKDNIDVIALGRNQARLDQLKVEMKDKGKAKLTLVLGDLSDNQKANEASISLARVIEKDYKGKLDILMHVAGMVSSGYHENQDGNEVTFATNHLSVMILTKKLYPYLLKSDDPRMLVVSSRSHYRANINFKNLQSKKLYNIFKAYKRSKLYNVFFVRYFAKHIKEIPTFAIDPGLVKTEIGMKNTNWLAQYFWKKHANRGTDAYFPTQFMLDIATKPSFKELSGHYFFEGKSVKSNPITYDLEIAEKLWNESLVYAKIDTFFIK